MMQAQMQADRHPEEGGLPDSMPRRNRAPGTVSGIGLLYDAPPSIRISRRPQTLATKAAITAPSRCACGGVVRGTGECDRCQNRRTTLERSLGLPKDALTLTKSKTTPHAAKFYGLDVTKTYCGCRAEIPGRIKWSQLQMKLYGKCKGDASNKSGTDIENCVSAEHVKLGITTTVAGTTSSSGTVVVKPDPSPCGPLWVRATEIHEAVHSRTQKDYEKKFGSGTPAFNKAWDDPKNWADDEIAAYGAEVPFYNTIGGELKRICP